MTTELLLKTEAMIREKQQNEASGHDWEHTKRVWKMARRLAQREPQSVQTEVVELAALLHDIADWKFHDGDDTVGPRLAMEWLRDNGADEDTVQHVAAIIRDLSYKGSENKTAMQTLEGKIVQDADRLDAVGYIGIARTFAYGGHAGQALFDPTIEPRLRLTPDEYKDRTVKATTVNHFYEKLLQLKGSYHTEEAKRIGEERHRVMIQFLTGLLEDLEVEEPRFHELIQTFD
ncbi:HD domain-containing protein [Atopococcus tabaci]|uniref:HD domain-containing protein n=1 Tax=Atopococcus tabaci TaxID=269774 RepID=UPI000403EDBF|nr:HD domain-containing protein [Atopococcus tabaci]